MSKWQPIETAPFVTGGTPHFPKRRTAEMLVWDGSRVRISYWSPYAQGWLDTDEGEIIIAMDPQPTHWMPLPTPPNSKAEDTRLTQADAKQPKNGGDQPL